MRNLQKILALVLALVMSLSLMASAGARDFTDGDQIDETFAESVDVLTGLEVFQGYPSGDFQPKGDITRAEVAAIIYRIATGDVTDSQVGIYADYNKFSDVPSDNWAAGYINYCANAEYIKGRGDGKFYPQDKVTGYEALAMILRVVGYDKNGEFTGADWQVQTAATANQRKVTKNVNAGTLGNPASRETVAELLCQAILINTVNYTLAFGYQISTDPEDTIAYQTFKMEKLEGVVTGNEVADLKESSPLTAGQTRLVIDGREEIVDIPTTLDKIGKSVRAYIRPQGGTTRKQLVTADVYDTELNHVYDSFAPVSSVGNSTGSEQGINSIAGAEHFINYDFVNRWTAAIRITYIMDMQWTEYQAKTMLLENGGRLFDYANRAKALDPTEKSQYTVKASEASGWNTQLTTDADYTYTYTKTIALEEMLTSLDYNNLLSIFTNADKTGTATPTRWITGEVYVGTASFNTQKDISDEIRWTDFTNTYLKSEQNRQQVEKNGRGNRLIIIDNDDDGIAEYVLQTIYTIGKISSDLKHVDTLNQKLYDSSDSDAVNSTVTSDTLVPVSGKDLAKTEEYTPAAGDVVIFALIDGNIRAQKAETKTEKVNTVNRAAKTITVVGEDAATYNESAVHTHSQGMASGVNGMAGNTTYTMYFDLDGNMAAYTEGANGGLVLITNGWHRSAIGGSEYAVQAYLDGQLQTVEVGASGAQFINRDSSNNQWGNLRHDFGTNGNINNENQPNRNNGIHTIIANLDGNNLTPVDLAYFYSQNLRMLDMVGNVAPGMNNVQASWGIPYETRGGYNGASANSYAAYNLADNQLGKYVNDTTKADKGYRTDGDYNGSYEVRGLSNTVYYVVYHGIGTDTMTNGQNVVVRQYTGSVPSVDKENIEDVYAVGAKAVNANGNTYYTAQMVVIEVNTEYNKLSEQVFIPEFPVVGGNVQLEEVTMIDGKGEKVTRTVDMYNSYTYDWYNTAAGSTINNTNGRTRLPGLYFIDPSDTNPDVYVVKKMSPKDIRDNNYLVGFVNESYSGTQGTLNSRYPQIELKVRPENNEQWVSDFDSTVAVAQKWLPKNPGAVNNNPTIDLDNQYVGKNVTDNSKLYLYNGTAASLTEDSDYNVFSQNRHNNAGTNVSALNERWNGRDTNPAEFPLPNRNEVLVRYSNDNIVWAVSFNETEAAQRVWWNCLPWDKDGIEDVAVTFHGAVNDDGNDLVKDATQANTIEVTYAQAKDNVGLTVKGARNDSYTLVRDSDSKALTAPELSKDRVTYTLTFVNDKTGATEVWHLNQRAASRIAVLDTEVKTPTANFGHNTYFDTTDVGGKTLRLPVLQTGSGAPVIEPIESYIKRFDIPAGATVVWTFQAGRAAPFNVTSTRDNWNVNNGEDAFGVQTDVLTYVKAVVTAEDGTTIEKYEGGSAVLSSLTNITVLNNANVQYSVDNGTNWTTGTGATVQAAAGTKLLLRNTTDAGRFVVNGDLYNAPVADNNTTAAITVGTTAINVTAFETYATVLGYVDPLNKNNSNGYAAHIGAMTKAASIVGGGRQPVGTVVVDNNWVLHTDKTGVELVAGTPGGTTTTWTIYANVDNITSGSHLTVGDLYVTIEVTPEVQERANEFVPDDSAYQSTGTDSMKVDIGVSADSKNNLDEFNATHGNILGNPTNSNTDDYVATEVNLQKVVNPNYSAHTFRVVQMNEALKLYTGDPSVNATTGVKTKDTYSWSSLTSFSLLVKKGNNAVFKIYPLQPGKNTPEQVGGVDVVFTMTVDGQIG